MTIETESDTLRVSGLADLDEATAGRVISEITAALPPGVRIIELDLSHIRAIDCGGVSLLMGIHRALAATGASLVWRVINAAPSVRQLLVLVRLHRLFDIVPPRLARLVP